MQGLAVADVVNLAKPADHARHYLMLGRVTTRECDRPILATGLWLGPEDLEIPYIDRRVDLGDLAFDQKYKLNGRDEFAGHDARYIIAGTSKVEEYPLVRHVLIVGHIDRTTDDAVLVKAGRSDKLWVPRSVIQNGDLAQKGDLQIRVLESWLRAKGEDWWIA